MDWRERALSIVAQACPAAKAEAALALAAEVSDTRGPLPLDTQALWAPPGPLPGRPAKPRCVPPAELPRRSAHTVAGRAALMHAVAHIELNAIDLAADAAWRFPGLPERYYVDWLRIAGEEAHHFQLVRAHLQSLGWDYGDFDAHDGLWAMVERTRDDVVARMALVPRTLEARGLDATPPMQRRLAEAGDAAAVAVLDVILRDEVGHVAVGNHWYRWLCERDGLDPVAHYRELCRRHRAPRLRPPFNHEARRRAGFSDEELSGLDRDAHDLPAESGRGSVH
jgi:uncharacterized ferritin-like protein (DUF455 family)